MQVPLTPLSASAVITVVPLFKPMTFPSLSTAATSGSEDFHVTVLVVGSGEIFAVIFLVSPTLTVISDGRVIFAALPSTVTVWVAEAPPAVVAVTVATPSFRGVIYPPPSTVKILASLLL